MSKRILTNVKSYFEAHLTVKHYDTLTVDSFDCGDTGNTVTFPALTNEPYDLYIMIKPLADTETAYFAAASSCNRSSVDSRPFSGVYYLNFAKMKGTKIKEHFYFSTFAHEFTHILGFSSSLFTYFRDSNGK